MLSLELQKKIRDCQEYFHFKIGTDVLNTVHLFMAPCTDKLVFPGILIQKVSGIHDGLFIICTELFDDRDLVNLYDVNDLNSIELCLKNDGYRIYVCTSFDDAIKEALEFKILGERKKNTIAIKNRQ